MKQDSHSVKLEDLIIVLKRSGFTQETQTEKHKILFKPDIRRPLSVPMQPEDLPLGTLKVIIRQAGLTGPKLARLACTTLGIKNDTVLTAIAIFAIIGGNLFVAIPSHIYEISGLLLFPAVYLSQLFIDRPNFAKVAILAFKVRTVFVLFIIPVILFLYLWKPAGLIFFVWMAIYLLLRITSGIHRQSLAWDLKWGKMAAFLDASRGYTIKYNPIIFILTIILTVVGLFLGYHFGGSKGLWLGIAFSIIVWLLNPFVKNIVVNKPKDETSKNNL